MTSSSYLLLCFLISLLLCAAGDAQPSIPPLSFADQRLAAVYPVIQKFKNLITSDPFSVTASWVGPDICNYKGFYCDTPPDNLSAIAVASVDFNGFMLSSSSLAGFLDKLPDIAIFHANSNDFSGEIPPETANLRYLYELDLSNNRLSGDFPATLKELSLLDLRFNLFSGSVPPEVFGGNLDFLFINNNKLITKLPDLPFTTSQILYLTLANNQLFGPIPPTIASTFSGLSEIILLNNSLTGCIPYQLGLLKEITVFDARNNELTGPLPLSLGCLKNLEILNLAGNKLYGVVPEILCLLGKLKNLMISDNYFTGAGTACLSLFKSGVIDLKGNCIPGLPFQRPLAECIAFFAGFRICPYQDTFTKIPCLKVFQNGEQDRL